MKLSLPKIPPALWPMAVYLSSLGTVMALMPRLMTYGYLIGIFLTLPFLFTHARAVGDFFAKPIAALAFLTVAYACFSAGWSPSPRALARASDFIYIALGAGLFLALVPQLSAEARRVLLLVFVGGWAVGLGIGIMEFSFNHFIHRWANGMDSHTSINEDVIKRTAGIFALTTWAVAAWVEKTRGRPSAAVFLTGMLLVSFISTSRSAMAGMVMGLAVLAYANFYPSAARKLLMVAVVAGLIFTVPAFHLIPQIPPNVKNMIFRSAQARLGIWHYTAMHVEEKPFFGHGLDASRGTENDVKEKNIPGIKPGKRVISLHPHNIFLQLWLDFGLVGVMLWGSLMLLLLHATRRLEEALQPYALGAFTCGLAMLSVTFSPVQAWWSAGFVLTATLIWMLAQSSKPFQQKRN